MKIWNGHGLAPPDSSPSPVTAKLLEQIPEYDERYLVRYRYIENKRPCVYIGWINKSLHFIKSMCECGLNQAKLHDVYEKINNDVHFSRKKR